MTDSDARQAHRQPRESPVATAVAVSAGPAHATLPRPDRPHSDETWVARRVTAAEPPRGTGGPDTTVSPRPATDLQQDGDAMITTSCKACGERFRRESESHFHSCTARDNRTGLRPGDTVRVGGAIGQVDRLDVRGTAGSVEVYFRSSFRSYWYPVDQVERVAS